MGCVRLCLRIEERAVLPRLDDCHLCDRGPPRPALIVLGFRVGRSDVVGVHASRRRDVAYRRRRTCAVALAVSPLRPVDPCDRIRIRRPGRRGAVRAMDGKRNAGRFVHDRAPRGTRRRRTQRDAGVPPHKSGVRHEHRRVREHRMDLVANIVGSLFAATWAAGRSPS